jgi:hypothetical protein
MTAVRVLVASLQERMRRLRAGLLPTTMAGAAFGGLFLALLAVPAALAHTIARSADPGLTSGLNSVVWAGAVLKSFRRAMLIMAGSFGLWRAGVISNAVFTVCVVAVVLVIVWILGVSRLLLARPAAREGW